MVTVPLRWITRVVWLFALFRPLLEDLGSLGPVEGLVGAVAMVRSLLEGFVDLEIEDGFVSTVRRVTVEK